MSAVDPLKVPRFGGIASFSRLEIALDYEKIDADLAILGVPFDGGTSYRSGCRFGPRALRDASVLCRNYNASQDLDLYKKMKVVDAGDVAINPLNLQKTLDAIYATQVQLQSKGCRVLALGGDHSILLANLRAAALKHKDLVLIHFDAHSDTADSAWGEQYHHGTPIRRAIEEALIKGDKIFSIGLRGPLTSKEEYDYLREQDISQLSSEDFQERDKKDAFFKRLMQVSKDLPVYISFDIDCIDPAFAPGTGTPVVGGLTSIQALQALRALRGSRVIGADLVEVSPPYDQSEITALLGCALAFEILSLMALA